MSSWQYASICSDNGLVPKRQQAIIWTIGGSLLMHICITWPWWMDTFRPEQNGWHFADDIDKLIFLNENFKIVLFWFKFHSSFLPVLTIENISALGWVMINGKIGNKALSEPKDKKPLSTPMKTNPLWIYASLCPNEFTRCLREIWLWFQMCKFQTQIFCIFK